MEHAHMTQRNVLFAAAVCLAAVLAGPVTLQGAKPVANEVRLNVSFRDLASDGVKSDASTPYQDGSDNVRAVLVGNDWGNFVFDTNDDAAVDGGRRLVLNFPSGPISVDVFIGTIGVTGNASTDGNVRTLVETSGPLPRRLNMSWVAGNLLYSLRWNGINGASTSSFKCVASPSGTCVQWTASGGDAGLYSIPTKGRATETYVGTFSMPFEMTLDRQ
jgi:hypothetical protein